MMPTAALIASIPTVSLPAGASSTPVTLADFPLTVPLSHPGSISDIPTAHPLVLSPSFPPVPAKLVAKIRTGAFVPLKELLGDNIALRRQRMEESNPAHLPQWMSRQSLPQMRNISTPLQWAYCMFTYIAVTCDDVRIRDMLAYAHIVLHLAQKGPGGLSTTIHSDSRQPQIQRQSGML